ncbi:MAG: LD-carboxypeptidase [Flavobacteriaceae bacterium]|nr:LD-carboxypeptidase [Flavobacteriaceae bacterium]
MVTPPFLNDGDCIGIVSTARKISTEEISPLLELITSWGLNYEIGTTINAEDHQFAGNDSLRIQDFQNMLDNPEIKAIWCARGGYGSVRLIDALDFSAFRKNPKWIIGYSDVTVFHSHIHHMGIETLHANMATDIRTKTDATRNTIKEALFGNGYSIEYVSKENLIRSGDSQASLVGGNLSILYSLCGSNTALQTAGKILFIEDLDEYLYHIDRMLMNLKRNGMLQDVAGLIVGGMNDMNDNTVPFGKTANEIVWEHVKEYDYPVCFGFPAGHIQDNRALILGRTVRLKVQDNSVKLDFTA